MFKRFFCLFFAVIFAAFMLPVIPSAHAALCGYANGNEYSSAPQAVGSLCSAGTPSSVSGSGPWSWTCTDSGTANCTANRCGASPAVAGVCNTATVNSCSSGSAINITSDATNDYWYCSGSNGGANSPQCLKAKAPGEPCLANSGNALGQTQCPTNSCFLSASGGAPGLNPSASDYYKLVSQTDFAGLMGGTVGAGNYSPASTYSGYSGRGDFRDCFDIMGAFFCFIVPDPQYPLKGADGRTFDSLVIGEKTRITIFKNLGYTGGKYLEIHGPAVIYNSIWKSGTGNTIAEKNDARWNTEGYGGNVYWSDDAAVRVPGNNYNAGNDLTNEANMQKWGRDTSIQVTCDPSPVAGACNNSTVNGCSAGSAINSSSDSSNDYWYCSGTDGGANSSQCSRARLPTPVIGVCNTATVNGCSAGSPINTTSDVNNDYWYCSGSSGGANSPQCVRAKPPASVAGVCNTATLNGCSAGSAINITSDPTNDYWYCSGTNGGANSPQCVRAKPLPPVAGVCSTATVNGCSSGSAINVSSNSTTDFWTCSGTNGGANSPPCSRAKPIACMGNITYSNQSLCADGRCYGYGYDPYSLNYPAFWTVNGAYVMSGNIDPDAVNNNPSNSGFTWRASTYNSTGQPNPPPFPQTTDIVYKVSATFGGATENLTFTVPLGSRRTPAWAPSSGAWYEGIYSTTQNANGAACNLRINTGYWGTIGGIGARDIYGDITCSCEGRPMSPPPSCGAAADPNGFRSAGEVNNAGLCGLGMARNVSGSGPWSWTCSTPNNGASVNCSASVCVPSSESMVPCEGNGYNAIYDNCGNFKRIEADPSCDFSGWPF